MHGPLVPPLLALLLPLLRGLANSLYYMLQAKLAGTPGEARKEPAVARGARRILDVAAEAVREERLGDIDGHPEESRRTVALVISLSCDVVNHVLHHEQALGGEAHLRNAGDGASHRHGGF